jgi:Zn-dependent protease
MGSILAPLFSLAVAGRVFIAWAKPVPVNPLNFSRLKRDDVLVSVVGPLSNIAVAFGCSVAVILVGLLARSVAETHAPLVDEALSFLLRMFYGGILLNIVLALFNLIPVPPLDGSHVLASVLPEGVARSYSRLGFLGVFVVIALMRIPAFNEAFGSVIGWIFFPFKSMIEAFL